MNGEYKVWWDRRDEVTGATKTMSKGFASSTAASAFADQLKLAGMLPRLHRIEQTTEQFDSGEKENVVGMNRQRMVALMLEHNITISAREWDKWRPTEEKTGRIDGVSDGLTCIMTNGLLGYFVRNGREPLYGHIEWFKWDEPETHMVPYIDEHGEQKFFKQVKDHGSPSPYYRMPSRPREIRTRKPKSRAKPITTAQASAVVDRLLAKMKL